jgi:hypothetical protein
MGKTFKYIADAILLAYAQKRPFCPICARQVELFRIYIDRPRGDGSEGTLDCACPSCIKTIPLRWIRPKDDERIVPELVNERHPKGTKSHEQRFALCVEMADEYRRTPRLPDFVQNVDWPHCCGDFAEYIGDAGATHKGPYQDFEWCGYDDDLTAEYGIEGMIDQDADRVSFVPLPDLLEGLLDVSNLTRQAAHRRAMRSPHPAAVPKQQTPPSFRTTSRSGTHLITITGIDIKRRLEMLRFPRRAESVRGSDSIRTA